MLLDGLTVFENICLPQIIDERPAAQMESKAENICRVFGIDKIMQKYPAEISGGEKQRTAVARALMNHPLVILADEPTGNLDSKNSQDVMDLLTQASRHYQQTILMITHSLLYQFYTFMQNMSCTNKYNFFIFVSDCCYIICHYTSPLSYSYTDKKVKYQKENNNSQESKESSFQN